MLGVRWRAFSIDSLAPSDPFKRFLDASSSMCACHRLRIPDNEWALSEAFGRGISGIQTHNHEDIFPNVLATISTSLEIEGFRLEFL